MSHSRVQQAITGFLLDRYILGECQSAKSVYNISNTYYVVRIKEDWIGIAEDFIHRLIASQNTKPENNRSLVSLTSTTENEIHVNLNKTLVDFIQLLL